MPKLHTGRAHAACCLLVFVGYGSRLLRCFHRLERMGQSDASPRCRMRSIGRGVARRCCGPVSPRKEDDVPMADGMTPHRACCAPACRPVTRGLTCWIRVARKADAVPATSLKIRRLARRRPPAMSLSPARQRQCRRSASVRAQGARAGEDHAQHLRDLLDQLGVFFRRESIATAPIANTNRVIALDTRAGACSLALSAAARRIRSTRSSSSK